MKAFNNVPNCGNNDWKQGQYVAKGSQNSDQGNQKYKENLSKTLSNHSNHEIKEDKAVIFVAFSSIAMPKQ